MTRGVHSLPTGIDLVYGRPGSGKSYYAVRRVVEDAIRFRRPVYTNLPLRWRVVRQYLRRRGGEELAGLFHPLSHEHFLRFLDRFHARQQFDELHRADIPSRARRVEAFDAEYGPPRVAGPDADWIPPGAIVCIDEAHHWFPNPALQRGVKTREPEGLLSYLTMHRHHLHEIIAITQADRQISQTWKSLMHRFWEVHPRGDDQLAWGIRFKHIGVGGLGYLCYSPEMTPGVDPPIHSFTTYASLPWNQWVFRLYTSFTHQGSARQLRSDLQTARESAGLTPDGEVDSQDAPQESFMFKVLVQAAVIAVAIVLAVGVGAAAAGGRSEAGGEFEARLAALEESSAASAAGGVAEPLVVDGVSTGQFVVGGRSYGTPALVGDWYVLRAFPRNRAVVAYSRRMGELWVFTTAGQARLLADAARIAAISAGGESGVGGWPLAADGAASGADRGADGEFAGKDGRVQRGGGSVDGGGEVDLPESRGAAGHSGDDGGDADD